MRMPDFFIVGAPKCGTTALSDYLDQHPSICMAWRKETHHFATDLLAPDDYYRAQAHYQELFQAARADQLLGEASVYYLFSLEAAKNIYAANSQAKIIAMLRNPVDQIPSYHSQIVYNGTETINDLAQALAAEEPRRTAATSTRPRAAAKLFYTEVVRYAEQLERYFKLFGREQVLVILYDDFKKDTASVYRNTLRFLGVDPDFQASLSVVNSNKRMRSAALQTLLREPPGALRAAARMIPTRTRYKIKTLLRKLGTSYEPRRPLDAALRAQLQQQLAPEVDRLAQLLDRDLSHWIS
jgi:hypothetical protein